MDDLNFKVAKGKQDDISGIYSQGTRNVHGENGSSDTEKMIK